MTDTLTPQFDLVLFDFDGTLSNTLPSIEATLREVFEQRGDTAPNAAAIRPTIGTPLANIIQSLAPAIDQEELLRRMDLYRTTYKAIDAEKTKLFPGVVETLRKLRTRGVPLAISSNKAQSLLDHCAERLGLNGLFDTIAGTLQEGPQKPDAGFFTQRIAALEPAYGALPRERVLVIGDAWPDLAFAANLGAASCYAHYGYGEKSTCMSYGPKYVIESFSELTSII